MFELDWKNPNLITNDEPDLNKAAKINVPNDSVVSNAASIRFTGRGAANYGEIQQENLMRLLENFADVDEPKHPTVGQTWYDAPMQTLMVCVFAGDSRTQEPAQWHAVGGIIITDVGVPGPKAKRTGQLWFQRTGSLSGILHISTLAGRYPSDGKTIGGWEQIYPAVETIAGRDEYDYILSLVNNLIAVVNEGSGAAYSILSVVDDFSTLDKALQAKYRATPDANLLNLNGIIANLQIQPNSQDWDQLLAAARYAINRLEVPALLIDEISRQPFVQDGRIVEPTLSTLKKTDVRYPAPERLANRRLGIVSLIRFYAATVNALKTAIKNRYSIRGINTSQFSEFTKVTPHITFSGSQAGHGVKSVMRMRFNFTNKNEMDRFLFSAGAIQLVISHAFSGSSNDDKDFAELLKSKGAFRVSYDDTRTMAGMPLEVATTPTHIGIRESNIGGNILAAESLVRNNVTLKSYKVSDRQFAIEATLTSANELIGTTTFRFSVIEDVEMFTGPTGSARIYPAPKLFAEGDEDGTSPWIRPGEREPNPEYPVRGQLKEANCNGLDKVGIYTDGKGGTYAEIIQQNSPECAAETPCEGELKSAGSILIPGVASGIKLVGRGAVGSTVYGGLEYYYSGQNGNNSIIFQGKDIVYAVVAQGGGEEFHAPVGEMLFANVALTYRTTSDATNKTAQVKVSGAVGSNGTLSLIGNADIPSADGSADKVITVSKIVTFVKTGPSVASVKQGANTDIMIDDVLVHTFLGSTTLQAPAETEKVIRFTPNTIGRVLSFSVPPLGKLRYSFCEFLPPKCPPRGKLLGKNCVGNNMVGTYADGACSTYTEIIEANSPECVTFDPRGKFIRSDCVGSNKIGTYADGAGGTYTELMQANSPECVTFDPRGKFIRSDCVGSNLIGTYADGAGGTYKETMQTNAASCMACNGVVSGNNTSTVQVPAGVTAVDFVGSGAPGTVGSSGPSTFTYVQKGAPYTTRKGSFVTNLVIGSPDPTTITGTTGQTAYVTVPVTWTVLPGSELASAGPKSRDIVLKGVMNGDQTITLKGNNAVFVIGGTSIEDVLTTVAFEIAIVYSLTNTVTSPGVVTPGAATTATIQNKTVTFAGSSTTAPATAGSQKIIITDNPNGVTLSINKPVGGNLTYNWCSYKPR